MKVLGALKVSIVSLVLSITMILNVFASDLEWDRFPCVSTESILLPPGQTKSVFRYQPYTRGDILASAFLTISNEGGGRIGVSAQTMAHVPIDKCRMKIYLDRWIEKENRWVNVTDWDFTFLKEDYPNGLTIAGVAYDVIKQPVNQYYRLRGVHVVWLNGRSEGFSTQTNGVLITKD